MIFTRQQILEAINNPEYKNGAFGQPIGYPVQGQHGNILVDANFTFAALRPAFNTALEVQAVVVEQAAAAQYAWHLLAAGELNPLTPNFAGSTDRQLVRTQDANRKNLARSAVIGGTVVTLPPVANAIFLGYSQLPITPRNPIILWGDAVSPLLMVAAIVANAVLPVTFYCREWPYDTDNY